MDLKESEPNEETKKQADRSSCLEVFILLFVGVKLQSRVVADFFWVLSSGLPLSWKNIEEKVVQILSF